MSKKNQTPEPPQLTPEQIEEARQETLQKMGLTPVILDYMRGFKLSHYQNSRVVTTISGVPLTAAEVLFCNTVAGNKTLLTGNPGTGKTQFMWDMIQSIVGEDHSLQVREELHRGDIKGLFRYLDRNAYEQTGRSDEAVKAKNLDRVLFGIEEITRSGPLQNSLFAIVDGEIYDDATGIFYRLGRNLTDTTKFHVTIATGNLGNGSGEFKYAGAVDEALATRFHLFIDTDEWSRTTIDDTRVLNARRGPAVAFGAQRSKEDQTRKLEQLLDAHKAVVAMHPEADPVQDAMIKYFSFGLDNCQQYKGGDHALVQHSKRAMKHAWPGNCQTCPKFEGLKYSCGAVRPVELRSTQSWIRLRNALEAMAYAKGGDPNSDYTFPDLLETIKLTTPYTLQWNPALVASDSCMKNPGNAARGMVAAFQREWNSVRDMFIVEAGLATGGEMYDAEIRKTYHLAPARGPQDVLPDLGDRAASKKGDDTTPNHRKLFSYLRQVLDDYNTLLKSGEVK